LILNQYLKITIIKLIIMCLITNEDIKTATEDIKVYKVAKFKNGMIFSPFQNFHYFVNNEYSLDNAIMLKVPISSGHKYTIREGFHSAPDISDIKLCDFPTHIFNTDIGMYEDTTLVILECIIPKDSKYIKGLWFDNDSNGIVSDKIIIIKILK